MKFKKLITFTFSLITIFTLLFTFSSFAETLVKEQNGTYFVNDKGIKIFDQWVKYNNKWYRTNSEGKILTGFFIDPKDNNRYFLNTNDGELYGTMVDTGP
ncbi:MAG: hypothetical protein IJ593_09505, partial [Lachnospiraceae bacterium]|nr:hypothetical protein [Lachnospiraceae bacterium]